MIRFASTMKWMHTGDELKKSAVNIHIFNAKSKCALKC